MEQQKIDLDALEAALARYGDYTPLDIKFALPALIAELRQLRARITPEVIGERHRDGNWWLVWDPEFEHWLKCRFWHDQWMVSGPAQLGLCTTPTHVLPMPPAPEAQ